MKSIDGNYEIACYRWLDAFYEMESNFIIFNSRDQLLRIDLNEIVYFEGDGNLTYIFTSNKLKGIVSMNLGKMEGYLATEYGMRASFFLRVGKKFIINMNYIYLINVPKHNLVLSDYRNFSFQIPVSKEALKKVKDLVLIAKH